MSSRSARIEQVIKVLDRFPIDRYPAPLRKEIRADLDALKAELTVEMEAVLARESSEMVGSIQSLLATLRINIDSLLELIE